MARKKKRSGRNRELAREIAKKPFEFVVYLFSEGETEARYLKDLSNGKNVQVVRCGMDATPWSLMRTARKWAYLNRRSIGKGSGIWVIFDDDEKNADIAKTVAELDQLPKGCNKKSAMPVINVGYMKPCIELWGAMCILGNARGLPQMHGQMESRLKAIMRDTIMTPIVILMSSRWPRQRRRSSWPCHGLASLAASRIVSARQRIMLA